MRELRDVLIDGKNYSFQQFSATKGTRLLARVMRIIGEPMGFLAGALNKTASPELIGKAVKALTEKLDEDTVERTVKDLLEGARCEGKPVVFDIHFAGQYGHLFRVVKAAMEAQFGDFFDALAEFQKLGEDMPEK